MTSITCTEVTAADPTAAPAVGGRLKRCLDLVLAVTALVSFSPLFLMIAASIKLSDGGPVLYRHQRVGRRSQHFCCLKFRTMAVNGDAILTAYLQASPQADKEWRECRKLKTDPRVTTLGVALRQLSLDELPQLINVIRGEMSLVGPRPIVSEELGKYGQSAELYFRARPGLTGAWQVNGRSDTSYDQRVKLDCEYVQNWSLWRDLVIIAKTIPAVMSARGSS
jgi:exopolysaccharide production protein ExoY